LDFAQNPTLPSAQGMTVVTGSGGPESTYSSILGNNRLKLDSFATGGDPEVYYSKTNFFATQGFNTVKYMGYAATNTYEFFINVTRLLRACVRKDSPATNSTLEMERQRAATSRQRSSLCATAISPSQAVAKSQNRSR
jgi:hypothetical protein